MDDLMRWMADRLRAEFKPAVGCTDPAAVAAAVAAAAERLGRRDPDRLRRIRVELSPNIFKNGFAVEIPGASDRGHPMAAALGFVMGRSARGFDIFRGLSDADIRSARRLIGEGKVEVACSNRGGELSIRVRIESEGEEPVEALVRKDYLNVVRIRVGGRVVWRKRAGADGRTMLKRGVAFFDLVDFAETCPLEQLDFVAEGIRMNRAFVEEGRRQPLGLRIGERVRDILRAGGPGRAGRAVVADREHGFTADLGLKIREAVSSGVDARMGGLPLPVMSSAGSGNLGIAGTIPLAVVCGHYGLPDEKLIRAVALANLVHVYLKEETGRLTAICGGVLVGMGLSAAIAWLLGGTRGQIAGAVKNMAANVTGMICDGANSGCALKVGASAAEAWYAAVFALNGSLADSSVGIVSDDVDKTIRHVIRLVTQMSRLDADILNMIGEA